MTRWNAGAVSRTAIGSILLPAALVACGDPGPEGRRGPETPPASAARAGIDTNSVGSREPDAAAPSSGQPDERSPMTTLPPDSTAEVPLRGQYNLATVDGEDLPAVTDRRPGCELQLTSGDLFLRGDDPAHPARFRLVTRSRERCGEEIRNEQAWETTGSVALEGDRIRLDGEPSDPGQIGSASGRVESGGRIVLTRLTGEAGPREVRWELVRLHDVQE